MLKLALVVALATSLAVAGAAYSDTSHILGSGGSHIKLTITCRRAVVPHPQPVRADINVIGQQVHCLIRRPNWYRLCIRHLGPPPQVEAKFDHGPGKPADWLGVDKLQAYVNDMFTCSRLAIFR